MTNHDHPFASRVNPDLVRSLAALALDKRFVKGSGSWLEDADGDAYLDFTAGYGALPFGHNPPEIWNAVVAAGDYGPPVLAQPSVLDDAGNLAAALTGIAPRGLERVTFANTGAEAIEATVKLARAATGRLGVLATTNGFHGKTLGALSATGREEYQTDFGAPVPGFEHVPFGDLDALESALRDNPRQFACFLVEPIQGEGGIRVPPDGYLREARRICTRHDVLLALDEIQTGLGRTGKLFAADHDGVAPDILAVAKALGGGLVPAAAVLYRPELSTASFALRHTSTFAGNGLAARIGLRTLDLLRDDSFALVRSAEEMGTFLLDGLRELRRSHPHVITDVRGRGLLIGVELTSDVDAFDRQCLLGSLASQRTLALAVCSRLLNVEHIRLAPTLLAGSVLRIEPPLTVTRSECETFLESLARIVAATADGDPIPLLGHLLRPAAIRSRAAPREAGPRTQCQAQGGEPRFAFVVHPLEAHSFRAFDPNLEVLDDSQLTQLMDRLVEGRSPLIPSAMLIGSGRVKSRVGRSAYGEIIGVPYSARHLLELPPGEATQVVGEAVALARERGAEVVGLGAYTSIVTANGVSLDDPGVPITTGNGFTAAATVHAIREHLARRGVDLEETTVAVLGAAGSIGRFVARLLSREAGRLVMVGNPAGGEIGLLRLREAAADLVAALCRSELDAPIMEDVDPSDPLALDRLIETGRLSLRVDVEAMEDADVVIAATSTPEPIVTARALKSQAVVCDVAQPGNTARALQETRPDVTVFEGGVVELPGGLPFGVRYGLPDGLTYACMAETMVLALDRSYDLASVGARLDEESVLRLGERASLHGFRLPAVQMASSRTGRMAPR